MRHNWTKLSCRTVVLAALIAAPCPARDSDDPATKDNKADGSAEVLKQLRTLVTRLETLERNLENDLRDLRSRGTLTELAVQKTQKDVNDLKQQVDQLRRDLDGVNRRLEPANRISTYAGPTGTATPATGRVRLVNTYFTPQTIVVNGRAYEVGPNQQVYTEPVPAGMFSFEVLGVQAPQTRYLAANETYDIRVHPLY